MRAWAGAWHPYVVVTFVTFRASGGMSDSGAIEPLGPGHREAAVALWREAGLVRPWNDPAADYVAALRAPAAVILGLCEDGVLHGTAIVGWDGHRGWIYYLAVAADRRGAGCGRSLVHAAEAWLAAQGAPKAQLMVREGNAAAEGFWRALGYRPQPATVLGRWIDGRPAE